MSAPQHERTAASDWTPTATVRTETFTTAVGRPKREHQSESTTLPPEVAGALGRLSALMLRAELRIVQNEARAGGAR